MKTTLEVPDELYREVKSRAALRRRKIKDYVTEGLRLALEAEERGEMGKPGPLSVFDEVRAHPLHDVGTIASILQETAANRKIAWRDEN